MKNVVRIHIALTLLLVPVLLHGGQAASDDERGWTFSQRFQGSSNAAGIVLKTNSTVGYNFNRHVELYSGLPVYFARAKGSNFTNGIGNAYMGLLLSANKPQLSYSSDLVGTAPTGDSDRGFSTGHATVDWTNNFSKSISIFTPYGSIGAANTVSDTSFFVRPFSSKGAVIHYEAGALVDVAPHASLGGSTYGVRAAGKQQVVSKVVRKQVTPESTSQSTQPCTTPGVLGTVQQTTGQLPCSTTTTTRTPAVFEEHYETVTSDAEILNDRGFSTWFTVRPSAMTDLQIGYSRSVTYQLNSLFFGLGFRVGH